MSLEILVSSKGRVRSIQPKFQPVRPGKLVHLKRWTRFFETFPVGPNRSIEFWTEISGNFGWMDRARKVLNCTYIVLTSLLSRLSRPSKETGVSNKPLFMSFGWNCWMSDRRRVRDCWRPLSSTKYDVYTKCCTADSAVRFT